MRTGILAVAAYVVTLAACAHADPVDLKTLKLPPGFSIDVYASDVPNARELAFMTNLAVVDLASAEAAARTLMHRLDCAVLIKGGHIDGDESVDVLLQPSGARDELRAPRIPDGEHVHGTGCALSSAITACLAHGRDLLEACQLAKDYVRDRIANPARPGRGAPAVV